MPRLKTADDLLAATKSLLGDALSQVEQIFERELASANPFVSDIIAHTRRFRGKRLRPVLCLLTAKSLGDITEEHLILSAVVEMIHTATLVHDDVLDQAEVRRHVATVNVRWNNETSVLYGDYLFTHAFHLAASTGNSEDCRIIGRATNLVCEGELMQVRNRANLEMTEAEYLTIIDRKTAELCAVACELGARRAGAAPALVQSCENYGRLLGQAFQIADDILDLVGQEGEVGKTLGTDLLQQKLTLPMIRLLGSVSAADREELMTLLQTGGEDALRAIAGRLRDSDALESARRYAVDLADRARDQLRELPATPARQILMELPAMSIDRIC